jgi:acyl-CoA synthetase (NDP forming)/RimJ/RimL family protein N-acetyltransferase
MATYPSEYEFDVLLSDGEVIQIRPIRPEDAELEDDFIHRVGPESMYQRFFRAKKDLTPEELRYFTNIDYDHRMALIALDAERMVAVGRYDVVPGNETNGGRVAEVAFLVEDAYHGRGIGALLLQHLTVHARLNGITEFEAYVLPDNFGMLRLFRSSGYSIERSLDEDVYRVEFPTDYSPAARAADWEHERRSVTASMAPMFMPGRVAVIGAEQGTDNAGGRILQNLVSGSYTGIVYPVNSQREFVHSIKAYRSVLDVPDTVDLAFVTVPPEQAIDVVAECGKKGVRTVVVTGWATEDRTEWKQRLLRQARRAGMRLLGPDSSGLFVSYPEIVMQGHTAPVEARQGSVGLATESGPLGVALLSDVASLSCGLSAFVSLGDDGDITANDLLIYWEGDPFTSVIALYVEDFGNPRRFGRLARRVSRTKPIVAIKGGRAAVGGYEAAAAAVEALFRSSGVIRAETMTELFDVAQLLARQPLPAGRTVAVIADAPGPASLLAGAIESNGLEIPPELDLGDFGVVPNPILTSPEHMDDVIHRASGSVDSVAVIQVPHHGTALPPAPRPEGVDKPVVVVRMGAEGNASVALPVYGYPEPAARALAAAVRYSEWRSRPEGRIPDFPEVDRPRAIADLHMWVGGAGHQGGTLETPRVAQLLDAFGITFRPDGDSTESVGEVRVTMVESPVFGPLIELRMAGTMAELAGDRAFRINPLSDHDADEMIAELRTAQVLWGYGGGRRGDVAALADLVLRASYLVENAPEIAELELDPVRVGEEGRGVTVGSARIRVRPLETTLVASRKDVPGRML